MTTTDTTTTSIRFQDGAAYERYMGQWSQLAGETFLDWLAPPAGQRWLDVGCGNGAFTERLIARCQPAAVHGIDPSAAQLAYARTRPALRGAELLQGDAMALPYAQDAFDLAVMPLVIFFVPDPARGVAEMARVVRPGGCVSAYAWDMDGGGFPYEALLDEIRKLGMAVPSAPSPQASRIEVMQALWADAGLQDIETRVIDVQRTFADFDDYWTTVSGAPSARSALAEMLGEARDAFRARMRVRLNAQHPEPLTLAARAHAVCGRVAPGPR